MTKVDVGVGPADDATATILEALPADLAGHLVRIEVRLPDDRRGELDERRIAERLKETFHYELKFVSTERARIVTEEFTMDPARLLADFVDQELAQHPRREAIKTEAQRILKEALA